MTKIRLLLPAIGLSVVGILAYACSTRHAQESEPLAPSASSSNSIVNRAFVRGGTTLLRFVNALPGSAALEIRDDGTLLFANVVFGGISPYKPLVNGARYLYLRHTDGGLPDAILAVPLLPGERYTVVAHGDSSGSAALSVVLDELEPDARFARIRVINAAPVLGDVVVRLRTADDPFITAVSGTSVAQVRDISPMIAGFSVRSLSNRSLATLSARQFAAGSSTTLIVAATSGSAATLISFVDAASIESGVAAVARR